MSEELIIRHCSPTLAGIKTGSLVNCRFDSADNLKNEIDFFNHSLNSKGVSVCLLHSTTDRALIYVYRPSMLKKDLFYSKAYSFLKKQGYNAGTVEEFITELSDRFTSCTDFPHEIGLFLGYPFADVKGFIENKGQNSKCTGCWKVYGDVQEAEKTFCKYKKCTSVYFRKYTEGASIKRLTVAA